MERRELRGKKWKWQLLEINARFLYVITAE
jgi:hypothetical protein